MCSFDTLLCRADTLLCLEMAHANINCHICLDRWHIDVEHDKLCDFGAKNYQSIAQTIQSFTNLV